MEEVRIDFVIKQEFRQIFEEKKQHIEELFSVKLEFDRLSEANRNADGFVWLAVIGTLTECNQAQTFIKALTTPSVIHTLSYPYEVDAVLKSFQTLNHIEKTSLSYIEFGNDFSLTIHACDDLAAVLAVSVLDDYKIEYKCLDIQPDNQIENELRRLSCEKTDISIDTNSFRNSAVKRAALSTIAQDEPDKEILEISDDEMVSEIDLFHQRTSGSSSDKTGSKYSLLQLNDKNSADNRKSNKETKTKHDEFEIIGNTSIPTWQKVPKKNNSATAEEDEKSNPAWQKPSVEYNFDVNMKTIESGMNFLDRTSQKSSSSAVQEAFLIPKPVVPASILPEYTNNMSSFENDSKENSRFIKPATAVVSPQITKIASNKTRRYVVIDGSNVAMTHGNGKMFSCRGIELCVQYFLDLGHKDVVALVPQWRQCRPTPQFPMTGQEILHKLHNDGHLEYTPSKKVGPKRIAVYDDRMMFQLVAQTDGVLVSNDFFRDLFKESKEWQFIISNRVLPYMFVRDIFLVPDDPFGSNGPALSEILIKSNSFKTSMKSSDGAKTAVTETRQGSSHGISQIKQNEQNTLRSTQMRQRGVYTEDVNQRQILGQAPASNNQLPYQHGAYRMQNEQPLTQFRLNPVTNQVGFYNPQSNLRLNDTPSQKYLDMAVRKQDRQEDCIQVDGTGNTFKDGWSQAFSSKKTNNINDTSQKIKCQKPPTRSDEETQSLFEQLNEIFNNEDEVRKILENHPCEKDKQRLSNFLLS